MDVCQIEGKKLAKAVTDLGLKLYAIHVGTLHGSNRSAAMYQLLYIKRAIDVLADAGADQLVFTGWPREGEKPEDLVAPLENVLDHMEKTPVKLGLENHYKNRIETIEDFDYLASKINHPQFGFTDDFGHFNSSQVDTASLMAKHAKRIHHVHIKDHQGTQSVPLGKGDVDVPGLMGILKNSGYDRALSVELEVKDHENLDTYAAASLKYLRDAAQKAGAA